MWDQRFEDILRPRLLFLAEGEPITAGLDLREVGLDSLGIVDLLGALEAEYGIVFADDALTMATFASPARLWQVVEELAPAPASAE